jgi:hypothetical protein
MQKKLHKSDKKNRVKSISNAFPRRAHSSPQAAGFADYRPAAVNQRKLQQNTAAATQLKGAVEDALRQRSAAAPLGVVQMGGDYYAYGSANTVPHVHVYSGGDCHLKIVDPDRKKIMRYNIIQNGKRHAQADGALHAASGNQALIDAINDLL